MPKTVCVFMVIIDSSGFAWVILVSVMAMAPPTVGDRPAQ